jgi:hypothetical protein
MHPDRFWANARPFEEMKPQQDLLKRRVLPHDTASTLERMRVCADITA